ncbi:hypothetical protein GN316_15425 [Xylophilus sp. Kf1]|nr:hypothetical protein [Xylophilus sp. Kf1]
MSAVRRSRNVHARRCAPRLYPALVASDVGFWLSAFASAQLRFDAFHELHVKRLPAADDLLRSALAHADLHLNREVEEKAEFLRDAGGLLKIPLAIGGVA